MSVSEIHGDTVRDSIVAAMTEIEQKVEVDEGDDLPEVEEPEGRARDDKGKFKSKDKDEEGPAEALSDSEVIETPEPAKPIVEAPQALTAAAKAKWAELPVEVQQEWAKRENDIHKMMTAHDGELRMGREMKEVMLPYMHIISAEGGTPATAVQSLLNTAYLLRTADPARKAQLVMEIAQTYGVDLSIAQQQYQVDPVIGSLQQELNQLKQFLTAQQQTQSQQEQQKLQTEVQAFAAKNAHFETVKGVMASLLGSGAAENLQEAYDMACHANPTIRSTLEAEKSAQQKAKRNEELLAKKKAAVSVTGSPGVNGPNSAKVNQSTREVLSEAYDALMGAKI